MTMMNQRVNANSPAQAVKSRARGPTITQLRAKQAALVAASELAASSDAEASVVRHTPVDEAKRWASGKGRKVGFAKARATFRGGGTGIAATAAKHDSLIKKARWRGTEQIARETPAGSNKYNGHPKLGLGRGQTRPHLCRILQKRGGRAHRRAERAGHRAQGISLA